MTTVTVRRVGAGDEHPGAHGSAYLDYAATAGRSLPGVGRLRTEATKDAS
ncbi:hypothetical protein [Streptomyces sp. TRM68367]|nr:hypothetical protein [Streptomyces sp. TRM68367]MBC9723914.1 hypothetical protein [Streptomyces sp. TRM68367]